MPLGPQARRLLAAVAILTTTVWPSAGQSLLRFPVATPASTLPPAAETPAEEPPATTKRAEVAELLRVAQNRLESAGASDAAAAQEVALYQSVEAVLAQHEVVDQQISDVETRKTALESELKQLRTNGLADTSPISLLELDRLKDELAAEQARADKRPLARAALERAERALDASRRSRREAVDAFEAGRSGPNATELAAALEQARIAENLAAETVTLRQKEVMRERRREEVRQLNLQFLQEKITLYTPLAVFTQEDLDRQLAEIQRQEEAAQRSLATAHQRLPSARTRWAEAGRQQAEADDDRVVAAERLVARQRAWEKLQDEIDLLTSQTTRLAELRVAWNRRFQVATTAGERSRQAWEERREWQRLTQLVLAALNDATRTHISRTEELRNLYLAAVARKADVEKEGPEGAVTWVERNRTLLEEMLRLHGASLVSTESSRRVHEKLLAEIGRDVQRLSPQQMLLSLWAQFDQFWNYEITTIGEGTEARSLRIKTVVTSLVIFFVGWFAAGFVSAVFANRLLRRFRLSKDATAAIRTLAFYVLLAFVALIALRTVNVPLTAFTILGGAFAIGLGFGSQALINNFIGGLIMLAERPVRLGERITFGNFDGTVEDVGFRCTKVRTLTDHLVTIPNSTLVNESIENIGRRRTLRRLLNLTITYDTPRDKIEAAVQAVRDILAEKEIRERINPIVGLEEFPPRVYFNDFNAESLNILVVYWYAPAEWWPFNEHCQRVNLRIMEEFERLGVDFAFPTQTLHLAGDPNRELAVRMLPSKPPADRADSFA